MFITPVIKVRPKVNEQRYCGDCIYINKNGYCSKVNMLVGKEKQTKLYIRSIDCLIYNLRESGAGNDDYI